jgi:hypothetical protein
MSFPDLSHEKHYSVLELAKQWGVCGDMIRRFFADEPGVLRIGHADKRGKRRYVSLRIPESVVRRVHARLNKEPK